MKEMYQKEESVGSIPSDILEEVVDQLLLENTEALKQLAEQPDENP